MAWNRPQQIERPQAASRKGASWAKGAFAGALVVALGIGAFFLMSGSDRERASAEPSSRKIPDKAPSVTKQAAKPAPQKKAVRTKPIEHLPQTREKVDPPVLLSEMQAEMKTEKTKTVKHMFGTATESLISMAIPSEPGSTNPPVPILPDADYSEDMKKAFAAAITADEDDTEETIGRKVAVLDCKTELEQLAKTEGWTLQDYIKALQKKYEEDNRFLCECYATIEQAYTDETVSDESYLSMKDQVNAKLKERGLPEVMSTAELEAKMEREDEEQSQDNTERTN